MNEKNKDIILIIVSIVIIASILGVGFSYSKGYLDISFIIDPENKFGSMITPGPDAFTEEETNANQPFPEAPEDTNSAIGEPTETEAQHETLYGDENELYKNETNELNIADSSLTKEAGQNNA